MLSKNTTSKFHTLNALFIPNSMSNILLIEDEDSIRRVLKSLLEDNDSYQFSEAKNGQEVFLLLKTNRLTSSFVILKCQRKMGLKCWTSLLHTPNSPVVMISGHGNLETAVKATSWEPLTTYQNPQISIIYCLRSEAHCNPKRD